MENKSITDQELAAQLRKPTGETGMLVADKMSENNAFLYKQAYNLMQIQSHDRVLEIGFGNGKFLADTAQQASEGWIAGIDFSEDMVLEARSKHAQLLQSGKLEIRQGTITALPYQEATFSKVFTLNTLYFVDEPLTALNEIHRVLQQSGMCCIGIRTASTMKKHTFTQYGFTYYELPQLIELLQQAGFRQIRHTHGPDAVAPAFDALIVTGVK